MILTFSDILSNPSEINSMIRMRDGLMDCCGKLGTYLFHLRGQLVLIWYIFRHG